MRNERPTSIGTRQVIWASAAISVIFGIVVGTTVECGGPSEWYFTSLTGQGISTDVMLIISILVVVLFAVGISAMLKPTVLVVLGSVLVLAAFRGPVVMAHIWPSSDTNAQPRGSFLVLSTLEFLGGAFLAAGLLELFRNRRLRASNGPTVHTNAPRGDEHSRSRLVL